MKMDLFASSEEEGEVFLGKGFNYANCEGRIVNLIDGDKFEDNSIIVVDKVTTELATKILGLKVKAAVVSCKLDSPLMVMLNRKQVPTVYRPKNAFGQKGIERLKTGDYVRINTYLGTILKFGG